MRAAEAGAAKAPEPRRPEVREADASAAQNLAGIGDSRWFAQLLGGTSGHTGSDAGSAALAGFAGLEVGTIDALVDQLAPRLNDALEAPLQALLHLPQLGRVSVSARRLRGEGWDIDLQAEDDDSHARLAACQALCEDRLGSALGQPVALRVSQNGAPA